MKTKKLPAFVTNPVIAGFFQTRIGRVISNWVLQGVLYMNPVEIAYKIFLDLVLTLVIMAGITGTDGIHALIAAWLIAHTINWIINCQPVALLMHMDYGKNDPARFIGYIERLERRVQGRPYLAAAASFGSLSKGKYKDTSDIDIRFVMRDGLLRKLRLANFCFLERFRAALHLFPLDLYAFDLDEMKQKMNNDEVPVIFTDPDRLLAEQYRETVDFDTFRKRFRRNVLGESVA